MKQLVIVTQTVGGDEKAWELIEVNLQSPGNRGWHRYQILRVLRDGNIAEWRRDLGESKNFKGVNQLRIPSLWEHTVDELFDLADELRGQPKIDVKDFLSLEKYKPA